jgi:hypothetical protein
MKKYLLFFLLLSNRVPIYTMEHDDTASCIHIISDAMSRLFAWFSAADKQDDIIETYNIKRLRDEIYTIEETLKFSRVDDGQLIRQCGKYDRIYGLEVDEARFFHAHLRPFDLQIHQEPHKILRYCYYLQYHTIQDTEACFTQLNTHADVLEQCRKEHEGGCSVLGAIMLAKKVRLRQKKRDLMQKFMEHYFFELTEQDRKIATLMWYDTIPVQEKRIMIFLLCYCSNNYLNGLPYDVTRYIMQYMLACAKQEYCFI